MSVRPRRACHLLLLLGIVALLAPPVLAQAPAASSGIVEGRVTDAATGDPLPGARLTIPGSAIDTSTDRQGLFRLSGVPAGQHTILITYLGRRDETVDVDVTAASPRHLDVNMGANTFEESVTVRAELILDAQARALNQQKTAANITNVVSADQIGSFPDANAAETVQRIPGISITKDQGEGRFVNIRGTDARLNSMMINGERIPAPDPLQRQVALDVVPSELLQAIEVSKALTPDMDGDAIGGSVNLVMKTAPEKLRLLGAIGGGYNQMLSSYGQSDYTLTGGRRLGGGRYGVIGSVTGSEIHRGNQDMEVVYTNTLGLNELNPRYYQVNRRRTGATGAFDFKPTDNTSYTLRAVFNRFIDDHENRQRVRWLPANSRIDRELRDRTHIERIASLGLTGRTVAKGLATIDYELLGAYSDQFDPLTMTTTFRETRVTFAPNVTATSIDPNNVQANPTNDDVNNYNFLQQIRAINFAKDRDVVGSFNAHLSDEYLARMALSVARRMHFESIGSTNVIGVSFSALDKVGHDYGPNSHEIQDVLVRLDRTLGDLFAGLDRLVGPGRYTVALTADHGVAPIPERAVAEGLPAGRLDKSRVVAALEDALTKAFGPGPHVVQYVHTDVYLRPGLAERVASDPRIIASLNEAVRLVPGIDGLLVGEALENRSFVPTDRAAPFARSHVAGRSGDLTVLYRPYWIDDETGTSHGTPYGYDSRVPLFLFGKGIAAGEYLESASPTDVAPTLAFLAGITLPRVDGRVLTEALSNSLRPASTASAR